MRTVPSLVACALLLLTCAQAAADPWDSVILRDDFTGPDGSLPSPAVWIINHPGNWEWVQGRTQFPEPSTARLSFPRVEGGACVIEHHLYNPWDPNHATFLGGEIRSVMQFAPTAAYRFEARVCFLADAGHPRPNGLVTSFFAYGYDGSRSDEIDFEYLSNWANDDATYPAGDPVLTNTWNESFERPAPALPAGLDLSQWNTFRFYWYPGGQRVEWTWLEPGGGEQLLRSEAIAFFLPDEPMNLYFNFWAPTANWAAAYDASLQPVAQADQDQFSRYEIDYAEVRAAWLPGDADRNGRIDFTDYQVLEANFGATTGSAWAMGDCDGDGDVDFTDYQLLEANFGQAIPEPGTLAMIALGLLGVSAPRRRRGARGDPQTARRDTRPAGTGDAPGAGAPPGGSCGYGG